MFTKRIMKFTGAVALLFLCCALIYYFIDSKVERTETHTAQSQVEIYEYRPEVTTCFGTIVNRVSTQLRVNNGIHVNVFGVSPGFNWHDGRSVDTPASLRMCVPGVANVSTLRKNEQATPLATDEVIVRIDSTQLFVQDPRLNMTIADSTFVVEDGYVVERDGVELVEPEVIFAQDGEYLLPATEVTGEDSRLTNFFENLTLGNLNIGEDASANVLVIAQNEVRNPTCLQEAWDVANPTMLATIAFENELVAQGYNRENIEVLFTGSWPTPDEIADQDGVTYQQRFDEIMAALPGDQDYRASECTSNLPSI